ncbi:endolytic transglycosylase MltG [Heyndrickxia oleronia]|uniref:Endolytic murein transglycosylase n=1 Tax=Heyndrickxia oleronia TaxID=38875 RepID=A0AAW6SW59_9BACI|nr:endolytic transglycosylase MltG [Heyndrickxia oleronia]MDH5160221.1 endolytic transglycosylase MltG [Heyndrickxia oleronia]
MTEQKGKKDKKDEIYNNLLRKSNEARTIRKIVMIISLVVVLIIAGIALTGYLYIQSSLKPVRPGSKEMKKVEIPIGSSASSIGQILEKQGIIKSELIFKYYVKLNNETGFQAGTYDLSPSMTIDQIITNLKKGKVLKQAKLKFTIPEGLQLDEIAKIIAKHTDYDQAEILKKLDDPQYIKSLMEKYPNLLTDKLLEKDIKHPLEGYLFPATYSFYEEKPTLDQLVNKMLVKTNSIIAKYEGQMNKKKLTIHETLTMASLIEEEATEKADRHKISSIFYNRIKVGMPLQTDPTVLYSLGKHKERVTYKDTEVVSPYNTYQVKGLPPSPISNAGETSIEAAINPEKTDYLYFLAAKKTGKVYYSKSLEEHNKLKEKYITNVDNDQN